MGKTIRKVHITIEEIIKLTKTQIAQKVKPKGTIMHVENIVAIGNDEFLIQCDEQVLKRAMRQAFQSKNRKWLGKNFHKYKISKVEMIENGILGETSK